MVRFVCVPMIWSFAILGEVVTQNTSIGLAIFLGAVGSTSAVVWKTSKWSTRMEDKVDNVNKKIDNLPCVRGEVCRVGWNNGKKET